MRAHREWSRRAKKATVGLALVVGVAAVGSATALALGDGSGGAAAPPTDVAVSKIQQAFNERGSGERARNFASVEGAIAFPAGTSYGEAIRSIYIAERTGRAASPMEVADSLDSGAVTGVLADGRRVVDLSAPYGWDPNLGMPTDAFWTYTGDTIPKEDSSQGPWPKGVRLGVPKLPACQILDSVGPCGEKDIPQLGTPDNEAPIPLP